MNWHFQDGSPIYTQLIGQIRQGIVSGAFRPGERLPSVRDLAMAAGVNPNTMQRALSELEQEGLLESRATTGRFVTNDSAILEKIKEAAVDAVIRASAKQYRELGLSMEQAAAMLLALDKEA